MNKDEALKMVIDYLEYQYEIGAWGQDLEGLIGCCKEALAQPAQEPVAWLYKRENSSGGWYVVTNYEKEHDNGARNIECYDIPLYTHPAPSWQGLSDDRIREIGDNCLEKNNGLFNWIDFARAIEQALRNKNDYSN